AITRPNILLFFPFAVALAFSRASSVRRAARVALGASLPILVAVSVRTSLLAHRPAGIATNGGVNFYLARAEVRALRFPEGGAVRELSAYQNRARFDRVEEVDHAADDDAYFYRRGLGEIVARPSTLVTSLANVRDGLGLGKLGGRENPPYWPGWMG